MQSLHDYHSNGYYVDGRSRSLRFDLARPQEDQHAVVSSHLRFEAVEGYYLEHDLGVNIIFEVEEQPISEFLKEQAVTFTAESKWGWPLFWQGSVEKTAKFLSDREARAWVLSSSYGLSGWVVAREATISRALAEQTHAVGHETTRG